eukprot:TRINITY_DN16371_c0_g1_i1.p1 TRINITY_DN16371_c0_g1~~TRINITY_DN16371_c0_g1_i1.p1  ORF type:complete len:419 (-),score=91.80 TRINITY_DN16371_c0_g1_i1:17-1273(-)
MPGRHSSNMFEVHGVARKITDEVPPLELEGRHFLITGSVDSPELNGLQGVCVGYNAPTKRYILELRDGRKVALGGGHLKLLGHEAQGPERAFSAHELAHMDRRELNLTQSDLSKAKKVHHDSIMIPGLQRRSPPLCDREDSAYSFGSSAEGRVGLVISRQESQRSESLSLSRSDTSGRGVTEGSFGSSSRRSEVWATSRSVRKNTFADDELHHAVQACIDEKVAEMAADELEQVFHNPDAQCYQHRLTQLATQLGRSITDSEKYYMDERIWRQHAYPEGRKPGDRRTRPTRDTLLNNVLSELGDERPEGTGVPQRCWDPEAPGCGRCNDKFTVFNRRHHCRGCGINVCAECSPGEAAMPSGMGYGTSPQRVCKVCLLYTSDAADEEDSVDLGGRRVFKKKKKMKARDVWWYVTGYIVS